MSRSISQKLGLLHKSKKIYEDDIILRKLLRSSISSMSQLTLDVLPESVLLDIFKKCSGRDLWALRLTCETFNCALSTDFVWKNLCQRVLKQKTVNLGDVESYQKLYTNLLYKYKSILGVYQMSLGHYGNLLEVKYEDGRIIGISMEGTSFPGKIFHNMEEQLLFVIKGEAEPPDLVCLPMNNPHNFTLEVNQETGQLTYACSNPELHISSLESSLFPIDSEYYEGNYGMGSARLYRFNVLKKQILEKQEPLISMPLTMPLPSDVPYGLKKPDGSVPSQIITPGLFRGDYSLHGVELILFKYVSESELHGIKVTGDPNIPAGKISIKCFLDFVVNPTLEDQKYIESLNEVAKEKRTVPIHELPRQPFRLPLDVDSNEPSSCYAPKECLARYYGECQVASDNYEDPDFITVHIVIFSNDLIGVVAMEFLEIFLFSRCQRQLTPSYHNNLKSIL